ncbi:MAG: hypothetical protein HZB33_03800 [Nitrospirae bacterium]|nr:hypothetical protein [Nitrospirota bacterium]
MAHSFTLRLTDELSGVLDRVRSGIVAGGGRFDGNAERGSFEGKTVVGMIKGEYRSVSAFEIEITITHKPFIVPYGSIESEIINYFS